MPQNKSANIRYRVIDKCLHDRRHPFPDITYLQEQCAKALSVDGKAVSVGFTTIQHDIQDLRQGRAVIGKPAPIEYSKKEKGYYYSDSTFSLDTLQLEEDEWLALKYAASLLFQYKEIPLFSHFKSAIERIDSSFQLGLDLKDDVIENFVQYEIGNSTSGYQWIYDVFYAIKMSYLIEFRYENIYKKEKRRYRAVPYLLKEFRNRWYMVVWSEEKECFVTFPLDRILEMSIIQEKQKKRIDFDAKKFFADSVGIFASTGKAKIVKLQFFSPFDRLLELEPLHSSQKIEKVASNSIKVVLKVDISPELINRLLSFGPACKVEKPKELVQELKRTIIAMKKLYP